MPKPFTKADADRAEVLEANLAVVSTSLATAAVTAGCQVYWPAPFEVCGRIRDKYNQTGGPNGFLLFPKTSELTNPDRVGKRSEFLGGNIYWTAVTDAHPMAHDFLTKWGQYGFEGGFMKYPTTDEIPLGGLDGRRQEFQGTTLFYSIPTGTHNVQGAIRDKYRAIGAQTNALGFPVTDETVTPDGKGRFNNFQNGAIYWSATSGAFPIVDRVYKVWGDVRYERSRYGYPIGNFSSSDGGVTVDQSFQNGSIKAAGPKTVQLSKFNEGTTPEEVLRDAAAAASSAATAIATVVEQALAEKNASTSTLVHDPSELVAIPEARGVGDLFYSDAAQVVGNFQFEHGHMGIFVSTKETVKALDPTRGVQRKLASEARVHNPRLMYVHASNETRALAAEYALLKEGSGYNKNFAFNRRDWEKRALGNTYNCSQLVWAAYMNATGGKVDIDGDGGWGVYPRDIRDAPDATAY
ncbi:hypothetical protein [Williamsia sp. CHRR-6]|uniref:hypothetical protein n=1 Tax=Williamsia sp. CHRR-6 TaxID=2835871 RepID=UPI001BD9BA7A|nr:hypothetical protein [Williamsia sp. CHRR-6]MBT0567337.1 hypothetical protein [Williamsia sp. CHRR-6]